LTTDTEVYAAGFLLSDPEFTLNKRITSKAHARCDLTSTSSIDHTAVLAEQCQIESWSSLALP
jgi:hypothetical protein